MRNSDQHAKFELHIGLAGGTGEWTSISMKLHKAAV
jgi:hypothetical protein